MRRDALSHTVRQRLERLPPPHDAHYGVVPAPPPEGSVGIKAAPSHAAAMRSIQQGDRIAAALPHHFPLSRVLMRQEAVNSSSIEDTHSTLDAVLAADEAEDGDSIDPATSQVREYALALEAAMISVNDRRCSAFTLDFIKDLHRSVMSFDTAYRGAPGQLRNEVVWIGGRGIEHSTFNPPPPSRIADCLNEHVAFLQSEGMQVYQQSIILRIAIAHAHFEAIHPFLDGNGRVGRLLIPLMLAADGHAPLYLAPYINANREGYYAGLRDAQQREDYGTLVQYLSDAIIGSVSEADRTITAINQLAALWKKRGGFRSGSAAARGIDLLMGCPVITAKRLAQGLGVTYAAANNGISALRSAGMIEEFTGHRRNRIFMARDVLRIFNRPHGDEPELPVD